MFTENFDNYKLIQGCYCGRQIGYFFSLMILLGYSNNAISDRSLNRPMTILIISLDVTGPNESGAVLMKIAQKRHHGESINKSHNSTHMILCLGSAPAAAAAVPLN